MLLEEAAIVAHMFKIDPVIVLTERDLWRRATRAAAAQYIIDERVKANEQAKAQRGR